MNSEMKEIAIRKAYELYGRPLPEKIEDRIKLEIKLIEENGLAIMYSLSKRIVEKIKEKEYLTCNRGKIGSSFIAYLLGVTEINPLPINYGGFDIPFELQEDIEKYHKIQIKIVVSNHHYAEICSDADEILKNEKITVDIEKNAKTYKREIKDNNDRVIGSIEIQTRYNLKILEKLYEITNKNPMEIEVEEDITKIGDILIKNELFIGTDIINLVDAMQEIEINTFDELIKILELLYNKEKCIFPKSHMAELALLIYKIGWYGVHYEKEFNKMIDTKI